MGQWRHVLIIGPQGSGKGTQAARVAPVLQLAHVAMGDLFRALMQHDTPLAREVRSYYDRGALVPDDLTLRVLLAHLETLAAHAHQIRGILLDGFPRTKGQAEALDRVLTERGEAIVAVVELAVPREVLIERLAGRLVCPACGAVYHRVFSPPREPDRCDRCGSALVQRSDDTPEAIARRLDLYEEQTAPLLAYYRERGLVLVVNGDQPIERVTEELIAALRPRLEDEHADHTQVSA